MGRYGLVAGLLLGLVAGIYLAVTLENLSWVAAGGVLGLLMGNVLGGRASATDTASPKKKRRTDDNDDDDDDDDEPAGARRYHRYEDHDRDYFQRSDFDDAAEDDGGY